MQVTIDPELKRLFFDRIMEMCGNSPYEAAKWIESVAYGENAYLIGGEADGFVQKIELLEGQLTEKNRLYSSYKKSWIREKDKRYKYEKENSGLRDDLSYAMDQIEEYKAILRHSGLAQYI